MIQFQSSEAMASDLSTSSLSFTTYSSETLADIAARVLNELRRDPLSGDHHHDELLFDSWQSLDFPHHSQIEDDFEFALLSSDANSSPVSADDIFCNGKIKPLYPISEANFMFSHSQIEKSNDFVSPVFPASQTPAPAPATPRLRRPPLRKLMFEERETLSCSSSASDADDTGGGAPASYCVWSPKLASAGRTGKKNKSTGSSSTSSRRWRLRDLLVRSGSHGSSKVAEEVVKQVAGAGGEDEVMMKKKKKSLLPYRQELVGIFSNVNGIGRNLHPF